MPLVNQFLTDNILFISFHFDRSNPDCLLFELLLQKALWFYLVTFIWLTLLKSKKNECRLFWGVLVCYFGWLLSFSFFFTLILWNLKSQLPELLKSHPELIDRSEIAQRLSKQNHYIWISTTLSPFFPLSGKKHWTMLRRSLQEILGTLKK